MSIVDTWDLDKLKLEDVEENHKMKHISFKEMLEMEVADLLAGYPNGGKRYLWRDGDGYYHEIVELDLLRGRFITDNRDFSEFEWEIKESHIYIEE